MNPKQILLIVNPVSGRMKSKTGLFEMLDELYRRDTSSLSEPAEPAVFEEDAVGDDSHSPETSYYGRITANTLGGDPAIERRVTVCPTMYRGHATQLSAAAADSGVDTVICCGGDGTLNETISGLMETSPQKRPVLGYIPAGSTNDFAASLGLPSTLRAAARMAVGDAEMPIDVGLFTPVGQDTLPKRYFSYIASFGIFTAASYSTPQSVKNVIGHLAYLLNGVKDLANIQPHHAVFELSDGMRLEGDYVFGAVTNTTSAAGIFKLPAGRVSMSDGLFEVFLVHNPRTLAELNKIAGALMSGNFDNCPLIEFHHTKTATITLDEPLSWSLDGEEAMGGRMVEVHCLPGAIRIKTGLGQP